MTDKTSGQEGEPGFRVTDRRRAGREEDPEPSPAAETPPPSQAEEPEPQFLPTLDLLRLFIAELHGRAWMHMGLTVDPATKLVVKDLPQARLAIDCIASLVEHLGPAIAPHERDELDRILADLRINFVRQSGG
jgi:hypothetical protein